MTHKRQAIRHAIAAQLETAPALLGRVVTTRARPTAPDELPVAIVYALTESSSKATIGGRLSRTLNVAVELRASSVGALDDTLDALSLAVEQAMATDRTFRKTVIDSSLTNTAIGLDGEGETKQAVATLTYTVLYQSDASGS